MSTIAVWISVAAARGKSRSMPPAASSARTVMTTAWPPGDSRPPAIEHAEQHAPAGAAEHHPRPPAHAVEVAGHRRRDVGLVALLVSVGPQRDGEQRGASRLRLVGIERARHEPLQEQVEQRVAVALERQHVGDESARRTRASRTSESAAGAPSTARGRDPSATARDRGSRWRRPGLPFPRHLPVPAHRHRADEGEHHERGDDAAQAQSAARERARRRTAPAASPGAARGTARTRSSRRPAGGTPTGGPGRRPPAASSETNQAAAAAQTHSEPTSASGRTSAGGTRSTSVLSTMATTASTASAS